MSIDMDEYVRPELKGIGGREAKREREEEGKGERREGGEREEEGEREAQAREEEGEGRGGDSTNAEWGGRGGRGS
jgi:hypothetical protein